MKNWLALLIALAGFFLSPAIHPRQIRPAVSAESAAKPFIESELIFPPEHWHNHASCIVECANGDLLVCWFHGSGERTADDVKVEGARLPEAALKYTGR